MKLLGHTLLFGCLLSVSLNSSFAESKLPIVVVSQPSAEWVPTAGEIKILESNLADTFQKAAEFYKTKTLNLKDYGRQYIGIQKDNRRLIWVLGFCSAHGKSEKELRKEPQIVMDGGSCYFEGEFDPKSSKFDHFSFNGEA
jgi:hypothetical protein